MLITYIKKNTQFFYLFFKKTKHNIFFTFTDHTGNVLIRWSGTDLFMKDSVILSYKLFGQKIQSYLYLFIKNIDKKYLNDFVFVFVFLNNFKKHNIHAFIRALTYVEGKKKKIPLLYTCITSNFSHNGCKHSKKRRL